jgi:hypothetical protein
LNGLEIPDPAIIVQFSMHISLFYLAILNRLGASSLGDAPCSHLASQKKGIFTIANLHKGRPEEEVPVQRVCDF